MAPPSKTSERKSLSTIAPPESSLILIFKAFDVWWSSLQREKKTKKRDETFSTIYVYNGEKTITVWSENSKSKAFGIDLAPGSNRVNHWIQIDFWLVHKWDNVDIR